MGFCLFVFKQKRMYQHVKKNKKEVIQDSPVTSMQTPLWRWWSSTGQMMLLWHPHCFNSFNCATLLPGCYPETGHTTCSPLLPYKLFSFTPYLLIFGGLVIWLYFFDSSFFFWSTNSQVSPEEDHARQRDELQSWTLDKEDPLQSWMFPEPYVPNW